MPENQALQVFYGSIPLILVLLAIWYKDLANNRTTHMLLKDILDRLGRIETFVTKTEKRLTQLESRAGIIFHE